MTAEAARKNIELNEPQKSVEKIRAEEIISKHEKILDRKIKENKFVYKYSLEPSELHGISAYCYDYIRKDYQEIVKEIASEIVYNYRRRGFKSFYSVSNLGYAHCTYNFIVDWNPVKNVSEKKRRICCLIS